MSQPIRIQRKRTKGYNMQAQIMQSLWPATIPSPLSEGLACLNHEADSIEIDGEDRPFTRYFYVCAETGAHFTTPEMENYHWQQVYGLRP